MQALMGMAKACVTNGGSHDSRLDWVAYRAIRSCTACETPVGAGINDLRPNEGPDADDSNNPIMNPRIPVNEIVREFRRGGQSVIFQSLQKSSNRKVVVKVLIAGALADEKTLERFRREIDAFAGLRHPYFVMDFVDGSRLNDHVASRKLDMRQFLGLIANICEGVYDARQLGIIHRDQKPANIIVDADGRPRIR